MPPLETATTALSQTAYRIYRHGVVLHLDAEEFDFHADVSDEASVDTLLETWGFITRLGFEPMLTEECAPELLSNGAYRHYLVPTVPVEDGEFYWRETA